MKIGILLCSARLNYGNDFINIGCYYFLRKCFPNIYIEQFEILDSSIDNNLIYPEYLDSYINTFDYVVIVSGSLISSRAKNLFNEICRRILYPKKILLGIGCFLYDEEEKEICKQIENNFKYIIVRDKVTYSYFSNKNNNVFLGIDLAFFAKDSIKKTFHNSDSNYMVLNIEPLISNLQTLSAYTNHYKKKFRNVYNVENTSTRYNIYNYEKFKYLFKRYLMYTIPSFLYSLYQNASYVITTRLHTVLVCLSNQVLVKYVGEDTGGSSGRLHLFDRFIKLQNDREYYLEDLSLIEIEKIKLKELLKGLIK